MASRAPSAEAPGKRPGAGGGGPTERRAEHREWWALAGLALALALLPVFADNDYYLTVMIVAGIHAILTLGLNLLFGYAGQISLGHAAFFGIAAYTTGILTATFRWPVPAGILAGVGAVVAVAWAIAVPTLKLRGHYLAMGTLGFGVIVYIVLNEATALTGGPSGLTGIPRLAVAGLTASSDTAYYAVVWVTVLLLFLLARNLVNSRVGRALRAIHTSEAAAAVLGVDTAGTKGFVFVLSAAYAGVAGTLYAHYVTFVSPGTFGFHASVQFVTMVVLGGMASLWGALAGAVFLTLLPEVLRVMENVDVLLYGAILVLTMMFLPGGLAEGGVRLGQLCRRLVARRGRAASA